MKTPLLAAALVLCSLASAFAITDAEIMPAALAGKTLTFTIETHGGDFTATGVWEGTYSSDNYSFTMNPVSGTSISVGATDISVTRSGQQTITALPGFIPPADPLDPPIPATITYWLVDGIGHYEVNYSPVDATYQIGTFVIESPSAGAPEFTVRQSAGKLLTDNGSVRKFEPTKVGKTSDIKTFTIKNTGDANLTGLSIAKSGPGKAAFMVEGPGKTSLRPGASTTFSVAFKPASKGKKSAAIHITCKGATSNPFDIKLTGRGTK